MIGLLAKILGSPVTGPIDGILFIADKIASQVDEQQQRMSPQARLMELESHLLMGDITPEEYKEQETELLKQIDDQLSQSTG